MTKLTTGLIDDIYDVYYNCGRTKDAERITRHIQQFREAVIELVVDLHFEYKEFSDETNASLDKVISMLPINYQKEIEDSLAMSSGDVKFYQLNPEALHQRNREKRS